MTGRIRPFTVVLQRRHSGTQQGYGVNAVKEPDKTVGVAHGYGFVANRPKVTCTVTKQHREDLVWVRGPCVVHYRRIGGIAIPVVQRGDQRTPRHLSVTERSGAPCWHAPATGCPLLSLRVLEIIRRPRDGEPPVRGG